MRVPQKPPDWWVELKDAPDLWAKFTSREMRAFVQRVNDAYLHWDKLRHQRLPDGVTATQSWAAVQLIRHAQRQHLSISFHTDAVKLGYWIPPKHQEWLHRIDQQAGGTIGTRHGQIPDDNEYYLVNSLMEEAIASSQLEGASTTREKAKQMLRANRRPHDRSEQMILNNYKTILEIRDRKLDQMTPELLCHFQEMITHNTLDNPDASGRFRRADEYVRVEDSRTNEVLFEPPLADTVPWRVQEICDFANADSLPFIHPMIKAVVLHFALGYVHPFVDGNGRTARALFYWFALRSGFWVFEFLPISRILVKAPAKYARAYLYTELDGGDVTYFIHYHLRAIDQAIDSLHAYLAQHQRKLREATKLLETFTGLNYRQTYVVQKALKQPGSAFTIREHQGEYRVTYATARSDLLGLEKVGLLRKFKQKKRLVFRAVEQLMQRLKVPGPFVPPKIKKQPAIAVTKFGRHTDQTLLFGPSNPGVEKVDESTTVAK